MKESAKGRFFEKEQEAKCMFSHLAILCECFRGTDCGVLPTEGLQKGDTEEDDL